MSKSLSRVELSAVGLQLCRDHGRRILPFLFAGTAGLVTTFAGTILLYHHLHMSLWSASALAIQVSILVTFTINSLITWRDRHASRRVRRLVTFEAVSLVGMGINEAVLLTAVDQFHAYYLLGLLLGSGLAAVWNYLVNNNITFAATA